MSRGLLSSVSVARLRCELVEIICRLEKLLGPESPRGRCRRGRGGARRQTVKRIDVEPSDRESKAW